MGGEQATSQLPAVHRKCTGMFACLFVRACVRECWCALFQAKKGEGEAYKVEVIHLLEPRHVLDLANEVVLQIQDLELRAQPRQGLVDPLDVLLVQRNLLERRQAAVIVLGATTQELLVDLNHPSKAPSSLLLLLQIAWSSTPFMKSPPLFPIPPSPFPCSDFHDGFNFGYSKPDFLPSRASRRFHRLIPYEASSYLREKNRVPSIFPG